MVDPVAAAINFAWNGSMAADSVSQYELVVVSWQPILLYYAKKMEQ